MRQITFIVVALTFTLGTAFSATAMEARTLEGVVAGDHRSEDAKARDEFRNPVETLRFFEVEQDMTVAEIWPGGGWYLDILAPYIAHHGTYIAAGFPNSWDSEYVQKLNAAMKEKLEGNPGLYGDAQIAELGPEKLDFAPEASLDRVLTFRNVHNWMSQGYAEAMFDAFYKALKPGGILGVVEHRAPADAEPDPKAESGYVQEKQVINMAEAAGFVVGGKSEINANPKDTADHPKGVWTLPPNLRMGEEDREKYQAIGESDRMTLKFIKPLSSGMAEAQ